jgi:hypothetical protein
MTYRDAVIFEARRDTSIGSAAVSVLETGISEATGRLDRARVLDRTMMSAPVTTKLSKCVAESALYLASEAGRLG